MKITLSPNETKLIMDLLDEARKPTQLGDTLEHEWRNATYYKLLQAAGMQWNITTSLRTRTPK